MKNIISLEFYRTIIIYENSLDKKIPNSIKNLLLLWILLLTGTYNLLSQTCTGNANAITFESGVVNSTNATGNADASFARLYDANNQLVLGLADELLAGAVYTVTWRATSSTAGPVVSVEESYDNSNWITVSGSPFTFTNTSFFNQNITASSPTRYLRFTNLTDDNLAFDAVTYSGTACEGTVGPGNPTCVNTTEIGGLVFNDFNDDGIRLGEKRVQGVSVSLFDDNGQIGSPQNTDAYGTYLFTGLTVGQTYRIEFTVPSGWEEGIYGTDSKTSVQFAQPGSCDNNLGILQVHCFCEEDPYLVIPCYVEGLYNGTSSSEPAIIKLLESADGHDFTGAAGTTKTSNFEAVTIATHGQVGAVYGVAWQAKRERYYTAALHKRYVGFGPLGPDGIYQLDLNGNVTGTIELDNLLSLSNTAGTDVHDFTAANNGHVYDLGTAEASFTGVGTRSFGDIEISDDGNTLYVVNLFDKKIYAIDVSSGNTANASIITSWNAPDATSAGRHRPYGLAYFNNKLWIGTVDENASNAYVHSLDPTGTTFNLELTVPLGYTRQDYHASASGLANWNAWATSTAITYHSTPSNEIYHAQPMLSDIEFAADSSMILGFRDRFGDQSGAQKYFRPSDNFLSWSGSGGDMLKACYNGGNYVLETGSSGSCSGVGGLTDSGPGGTEFYHWDFYHTGNPWNPSDPNGGFHWETAQGALYQLKTRPYVITTAMDPFHDYSGGILKFDNSTGGREGVGIGAATTANLVGGYTLYESGNWGGTPPPNNNNLSKANGLGDIEGACSAPPLEIGNYVWWDDDLDGLMDPSEPGIPNVPIELWLDPDGNTQGNNPINGDEIKVATTTTDAQGRYIFSFNGNNNGLNAEDWSYTTHDKVLIDTTYQVRIPNWDGSGSGGANTVLESFKNSLVAFGPYTASDPLLISPTQAQGNINDSNGYDNPGNSAAAAATGNSGENDHSFDFAFGSGCTNPEIASLTNETICDGENFTSANVTTSVTNSVSVTYQWYDHNGTNNTGTNAISGQTTATLTALPTSPGVYQYRVVATDSSDSSCSDEETVTLMIISNPTVTATATDPDCDIGENTGTITLAGFTTEKYDMNIGSSYIGTATYTTASSIPTSGVITNTLANPSGSQDYTVRIFNSNDCYVDRTVTINEVTCCPPNICLPINVTIQKGSN